MDQSSDKNECFWTFHLETESSRLSTFPFTPGSSHQGGTFSLEFQNITKSKISFQIICKESIFHWIRLIPVSATGVIQKSIQSWADSQTECNVLVVKVPLPVWVTLVVHSWLKSMANICSLDPSHGVAASVMSTLLVTIATGVMKSVANGSKKIPVFKLFLTTK